MSKERVIYTRELLDSLLQRDNAELIGDYPNITCRSIINYKCTCGILYEKLFNQIYKYCGAFCKECTKIKTINKKKDNIFKKYGVESIFQVQEFKDRINQIMIEKYGVKNPLQNKEIYNKRKETILEKYGVEHIFSSNIIKDKVKKTNLKRYGVENPLKNKDILEKMKNTNLEKYGVENPLQNPECLEKTRKTNLEKYGVENPLQCPEILEKMKKTNLERYGVENPIQNDEIYEKMIKTMRKFKDYIMPSGDIRRIQGYEHFALNDLLKNYKEETIITRRKYIPRINYQINNKNHFYYPDIYIPSENKIIEVKSSWTFGFITNNIKEKTKATIKKGYNYEIWCYNSKGERVLTDEVNNLLTGN